MTGDTEGFFHSPLRMIALAVNLLLVLLLRGNMILMVILSAPFLCIGFKRWWKRLLPLLAVPVAVYLVINGPVMNALHILPGHAGEPLSIPIMQIADVVGIHEATLSEDDKAEIDLFLEYDQLHASNPRFADSMKLCLRQDYYKAHSMDFMKMWVKLGVRYPVTYLNALLALNVPYWYQDSDPIDPYAGRMYIETTLYQSSLVQTQLQSKLPGLWKFLERTVVMLDNLRGIPLIYGFMSLSTPLWMLLACLFILKAKGKTKAFMPLLPMLVLMIIYLLGPVSIFRYVLPIFICYPLIIALALQPDCLKRGA